jgi:hypothetical protein
MATALPDDDINQTKRSSQTIKQNNQTKRSNTSIKAIYLSRQDENRIRQNGHADEERIAAPTSDISYHVTHLNLLKIIVSKPRLWLHRGIPFDGGEN